MIKIIVNVDADDDDDCHDDDHDNDDDLPARMQRCRCIRLICTVALIYEQLSILIGKV